MLSPAHTVRFWSSETNLENPKGFYNPRLKSLVFDRWFDMFTDSRLMAVAIKFHLRRNSGSVLHSRNSSNMLPFLYKHCYVAAFMWVCRSAYARITTVHVLFIIANISVTRAMQLAVTGRVWVDNVKLRTSFLARTHF